MAEVNALSLTSFITETHYQDVLLGEATSFAYKYKGEKYLITNYHVAYGRNPNNGQPLNPKCAIPNSLTIKFYTPKLEPKWYKILYGIDDNPFNYIEINNRIVDVAVYKLDEKFTGICINEVNELFGSPNLVPDIPLQITDSLYVLGFPRGINIILTPIWKKSSVASEPEIDIDGIPYFYIDSTTREGMSGSPVIFYTSNGEYSTPHGHYLCGGNTYNFIGIYSGRDRNDESHIAQLGIVWKKELIEKIIEDKFLTNI